MDSVCRAAFIISQSICAMAEIEAMRMANLQWVALKENGKTITAMPHSPADFARIPEKYGLYSNAVIGYLNG